MSPHAGPGRGAVQPRRPDRTAPRPRIGAPRRNGDCPIAVRRSGHSPRGRTGGGDPPVKAPPKADDAINLGATVLPILVKHYWKPGVAVLVLVALIVVVIVAL